ncbi:MAG: EamA family transporter, partial [Rhodospirillales bacterium]|nr:EamA family transporter [Rhodospirillales bacterium]
IALGVIGILFLFGRKALAGQLQASELLGAGGVVVGCLCYSFGSVLARPLMRSLSPADVAGATNLIGGLVLLVLSLAFEPGARTALAGQWGFAAWSAWLFLLLPGSLGATIIYFFLMRDWGASRTGSYAFVSPIISVLLGMVVLGEQVGPFEVFGMLLMLAAAGIVLRWR